MGILDGQSITLTLVDQRQMRRAGQAGLKSQDISGVLELHYAVPQVVVQIMCTLEHI